MWDELTADGDIGSSVMAYFGLAALGVALF